MEHLSSQDSKRTPALLRSLTLRPRGEFAGFVWGLALSLVSACSMAQDLTIAVSRTSLSLPLYVAESQKFFADEGLSVQTRECIGGQRSLTTYSR